ncbi:MAG TPA: glycoside hydrolase family 3 N-terminal domain-containing protein [Intrasporangium sp.]|jgi:beta-N-acetylhexosaminidase|uniref:glycoside hydrolase family 3 protein n=1 Tax=Intrasporangium sp. TaxID=1925024 RepID=UPI002F93BF30
MAHDHGVRRRLVLGTLMPGFEGTTVPAWIDEAYAAGLASVCLHGPNMAGSQALSSLCASLRAGRPDVLIAVDEEGGDVTRVHYLEGSPEPGNAVLGRLDDTRLTRDSAARVGRELTAYGINLDFAPVVDVNSADDNPVIGVRSFGVSPQVVGRHSAAWIAGLQEAGVAACAKHFPGHGDTAVDSHLGLPRVTASREVLDERELEPFRAAVDAGVACVMTAHIVGAIDPEVPATFSERVLRGVLRQELGFDGVIVSDALDMVGASGTIGVPEAAVRALVAGCDLLCLGSQTTASALEEVVDAVLVAVAQGRLAEEQLVEAHGRVARLAAAYPAANPPSPPGHWPSEPLELEVERAFEIAEVAQSWLASPEPPCIVQVETWSNPAVGIVPWGPAAIGAATDPAAVPKGAKVAVVGRGLVAGHPAWDLFERLRAGDHRTIIVECGWPRGGADIVTFGGSAAVARALVRLLGVPA